MAMLLLSTAVSFAMNYALQMLLAKPQEGPRLENLKLQNSEFGKMIPIQYGINRLPGIVHWQTDLVEHKHTSGGKGGPKVTTYTYTISFSCKLCEGPMAGVTRIWADQTLIYDVTGGATGANLPEVPLTIYLGEDDQQPDPTMEAILGVGQVPGDRGYCKLSFADWDVGKFGNRIPSINAEVFSAAGDIPWRVSTFPTNVPTGKDMYAWSIDEGIITITAGLGSTLYFTQYDIQGNVVTPTITSPLLAAGVPIKKVSNLATTKLMYGPDPSLCFWWNADANGNWYQGAQVFNPFAAPDISAGQNLCYGNGVIYYATYSLGNIPPTLIATTYAPDGIPNATYGPTFALDTGYSPVSVGLCVGDDGNVYATAKQSGTNNVKVWKLDPDLNLLEYYPPSDCAGTLLNNRSGYNIQVYKGQICFSQYFGSFAPKYLTVVKLGHPCTNVNSPLLHTGSSMAAVPLTGGLGIDYDGVYSLDPPPAVLQLGRDIVAPISERAGLSSGDIDVTQLIDSVYGYTIANQMAARDAITPLQMAYYFDAVESGGVVKFVKRGAGDQVSIPDNDLAAQMPGAQPPPLITVKRTQEQDLPATLNVNYVARDADYQVGTQYARRLVTNSQANVTAQLSVVLSDQEASTIAWTNLFAAWMERERFTVLLSRKYWPYEPTDMISAHGYLFRVIDKSDVAGGIIQLEGVYQNDATWVQGQAPASVQGFSSTTPPIVVKTVLQLLDIPMVQDTDNDYGPYAAMGPISGATFQGATVYKSTDGGTNFDSIGNTTTQVVMATANDVLGNFSGGNIFDELNTVTATISAGGGDFVSASASDVLNGNNFYLVGDELIQVKVATEVSAGVWALSGLLRGRRGTEWAMPTHVAGERVVYLPALDTEADLSELGQARQYKAVTTGMSMGSAAVQTFTNNGAAARPYAPVNVAGGSITPFDGTVQITWIRRTRKGGQWVDFADVALGEAQELYVLQIWNSTYTLCARVVTGITTPTYTYTAAMQVTDFGATQQHIYVTVGQVGAYRLGIQTPAIIAGTGASDTAPLAPVDPYNSPPSVPGDPSLTLLSATMNWAAPVQLTELYCDPTHAWVVSFTTGAAVGGTYGGLVEFYSTGPQIPRTATISLTPNGPPLNGNPGSTHANYINPTILFYMLNNPNPTQIPTLLPSTTYYVTLTSDGTAGATCDLTKPS